MLSPNQRLLHKLGHYGIRETTLNWIQNVLTNRTQEIVVDGSSSESACVKSGVPQGTILGPLLFLPILMTSLPGLLAESSLCIWLPPISPDKMSNRSGAAAERPIHVLQDWTDWWGMCYNASKCSVLRVYRPKLKKNGISVHPKWWNTGHIILGIFFSSFRPLRTKILWQNITNSNISSKICHQKKIDKQPVWHLSFIPWAGISRKQDQNILDFYECYICLMS